MKNQKQRSELYTNEFRWYEDKKITVRRLQQKVRIIRHYPTPNEPVGIHTEWHDVLVDDKKIELF